MQTCSYCYQLKFLLPSKSPLPKFLNYLYHLKKTKQPNGNSSCHVLVLKPQGIRHSLLARQPSLGLTNTTVSESVTHLRQPFYIPLVFHVMASIKKSQTSRKSESHLFSSQARFKNIIHVSQFHSFIIYLLFVVHLGQIFTHFKHFRKCGDRQSIWLILATSASGEGTQCQITIKLIW